MKYSCPSIGYKQEDHGANQILRSICNPLYKTGFIRLYLENIIRSYTAFKLENKTPIRNPRDMKNCIKIFFIETEEFLSRFIGDTFGTSRV